jgi:hypothetical protein
MQPAPGRDIDRSVSGRVVGELHVRYGLHLKTAGPRRQAPGTQGLQRHPYADGWLLGAAGAGARAGGDGLRGRHPGNAISIGGDSDTLVAIASPVAGARFSMPEAIALEAWKGLPEDMHRALNSSCTTSSAEPAMSAAIRHRQLPRHQGIDTRRLTPN